MSLTGVTISGADETLTSVARRIFNTKHAIVEIEGIPLKGRFFRSLKHKAWAHERGCVCAPHETFTCERCGRRVGHCLGGCDDGACNFCWAARRGAK